MSSTGVSKQKRNWENPLGYWCAPNAATPNYVAAWDVLEVLGYSWMVCASGWCDKIAKSPKFKGFVREIREKLLNNFYSAIDMIVDNWKDIEEGEFPFSYDEGMATHDDMCVVEEFDGEELVYGFHLVYREASEKTLYIDNEDFEHLVDVMLAFGVNTEDDTVVWLSLPKSKIVLQRWLGQLDEAKKVLKEIG